MALVSKLQGIKSTLNRNTQSNIRRYKAYTITILRNYRELHYKLFNTKYNMHTENIVVTQKHWSTEHKYKIEELEDYTPIRLLGPIFGLILFISQDFLKEK